MRRETPGGGIGEDMSTDGGRCKTCLGNKARSKEDPNLGITGGVTAQNI